MTENAFANQVRQLKSLEVSFQADYTERALTVLNLRLQAIADGPGDEEAKARLTARAERQWAAFMGRPVPANG